MTQFKDRSPILIIHKETSRNTMLHHWFLQLQMPFLHDLWKGIQSRHANHLPELRSREDRDRLVVCFSSPVRPFPLSYVNRWSCNFSRLPLIHTPPPLSPPSSQLSCYCHFHITPFSYSPCLHLTFPIQCIGQYRIEPFYII